MSPVVLGSPPYQGFSVLDPLCGPGGFLMENVSGQGSQSCSLKARIASAAASYKDSASTSTVCDGPTSCTDAEGKVSPKDTQAWDALHENVAA